jgi:hypothetical protein
MIQHEKQAPSKKSFDGAVQRDKLNLAEKEALKQN